jgi:indolepyruvate ferredoxin oxidoreductase beta subunit
MARIIRNTTNVVNVAIAGVGGQGVLTLAEVLAKAATFDGHNVRVGEIHGMAQRGGHVLCTVRIGDGAKGPIIDPGMAHLLVGFEPIETLREIQLIAPDGCVLMNSHILTPVAVSMSQAEYPSHDTIVDAMGKFTTRIVEFNAAELAEKAGSAYSLNMVMFGAAVGTGLIPVSQDSALDSIRNAIPGKLQEMNTAAFNLGLVQLKELL